MIYIRRFYLSRAVNAVGACAFLFIAAVFSISANARSPARTIINFSVSNNVGSGNALFLAGNQNEVGQWNPPTAPKLRMTSNNIWSAQIAVQSGTIMDFKFVGLPLSFTGVCVGANQNWIPPGTGNHSTTSYPALPPAHYTGKTIYYHSGWTNAVLIYSTNGVNFTTSPMSRIGQGRWTNEYLYLIQGIGVAGEGLQFIPSDGGTNYDHAPYPGYGGGDYYTTLDVSFLQDGNIYNYWPPATVSVPRIIASNAVSTHAPSPSRTMKIYLPRGYDQNTWKRYPVVYMHDGENVFAPGGTFGSWDSDLIATRETSQGRMREAIIVGLNSTANRTREYLPPEDNSGGQGFGDTYLKFLVYDVKAKIDTEFRTLPDAENTLTIGASSGGLITTYLGWATNVFGKIGPFSPAYLISPNYNNIINAGPKRNIRIFTQTGNVGSPETSILPVTWTILDYFIKNGYVYNVDLVSKIGCGDAHGEVAWAKWLPDCFHFLLDIWDEANPLAAMHYPPEITGEAVSSNETAVSIFTLKGRNYRLERTDQLVLPDWTPVSTGYIESMPWSSKILTDTNSIGSYTTAIYRVVSE